MVIERVIHVAITPPISRDTASREYITLFGKPGGGLRLLQPRLLGFFLDLEEGFHGLDRLPLDLALIALDQRFHFVALVFLGEADDLLVSFRIRLGVRQHVGGQFLGSARRWNFTNLVRYLEDRLPRRELTRSSSFAPLRPALAKAPQLEAPHAVDASRMRSALSMFWLDRFHVVDGGVHDVHSALRS